MFPSKIFINWLKRFTPVDQSCMYCTTNVHKLSQPRKGSTCSTTQTPPGIPPRAPLSFQKILRHIIFMHFFQEFCC